MDRTVRAYVSPDANPRQRRYRYLAKRPVDFIKLHHGTAFVSHDAGTGIFSIGEVEAIKMSFQGRNDVPLLLPSKTFGAGLKMQEIQAAFNEATSSKTRGSF